MRIALIHARLVYRGGLESRLLAYMHYLHAQGHEVTLCIFKRDPSVQVPVGVRVKHFNLKYVPKPLRSHYFNHVLKRFFKQEPFDLKISMGRTTCHDALIVAGNHRAFVKATGQGGRGFSDWLQVGIDDKSYKAPGVLLPASDMLRDQLMAEHQVPAEKMRVLYPPTDGKRFHVGLRTQREEFRRKHGFSPDKRTFLLISANHALKGLPILLQVFEQLQHLPIELVVAGGKPIDTTLPNVRHLGFVRETEELYAAGDYLVLPSRYDSFAQVVTESLFCGTPAIVSCMTGAKAIVGPNEGIVVPTFEVADWRAAIEQALATEFHIDPQLAEHNGLVFADHMGVLLSCAGNGGR